MYRDLSTGSMIIMGGSKGGVDQTPKCGEMQLLGIVRDKELNANGLHGKRRVVITCGCGA